MNITLQQLKSTEASLRHTIASRLVGANRTARVAEARRLLGDKQESVEALRQLIALMDAAGHAGLTCGDVVGYRKQLTVELADLERLTNVVAVFDELFQGDQQ